MMQNKKKIIGILAVIILACGFCVRVNFVNTNIAMPVTKEYQKGEKVPYEKDYTNQPEESIDGYSITVLDSELLTTEAFYKKYSLSEQEISGLTTKWYYVVKVSFANENNQSGTAMGISLYNTSLVSKTDYAMVDYGPYSLLNPDMPGLGFSLTPGTDKEVILTYPITSTAYDDMDDIKNANFQLQITQYPVRKMINIE